MAWIGGKAGLTVECCWRDPGGRDDWRALPPAASAGAPVEDACGLTSLPLCPRPPGRGAVQAVSRPSGGGCSGGGTATPTPSLGAPVEDARGLKALPLCPRPPGRGAVQAVLRFSGGGCSGGGGTARTPTPPPPNVGGLTSGCLWSVLCTEKGLSGRPRESLCLKGMRKCHLQHKVLTNESLYCLCLSGLPPWG